MTEFVPTTQPWIVCAACRNTQNGVIAAGARHFDGIMKAQIESACRDDTDMLDHWRFGWSCADQGFIDQWGRFYEREEAWQLAEQNGQIAQVTGPKGILFSEDLY